MAARRHGQGVRAARGGRPRRGARGGDRLRQVRGRERSEDNRGADGDVRRSRCRVLAPGGRGDRAPGHSLHRDLHLRLPAPLLPVPRRGRDGGTLRPRHRGGDPGDSDQGGLPEVRSRRARHHAEHREGAPRHRAGKRAHRDAHHGPLTPGKPDRAGAGGDLRGRGCRPVPGADRPHRRYRRLGLHREAARQGRVHRHGPLRAGDLPAHRPSQCDRHGAAGARLRRAHVPVSGLLRNA